MGVGRDVLAAKGVLYPRLPGARNHAGLPFFVAGEGDRPPNPRLMGVTGAEVASYKSTFLAKLRAEIEQSHCDMVVFSSEHLSSRLRKPESVAALIAAMKGLAEEVRVIAYLRPQYELYPSSYSTTIKSGGTQPVRPLRGPGQHFLNYEKMLALWDGPAGLDNMRVRRFGKAYFKDGDLITDFFSVLGMEVPDGVRSERVLNTALDAYTLEFLRLANEVLPRTAADGGEHARVPLIKALEKMSLKNSQIIPGAMLAEVDETFRASNKRVAARYFPEIAGDLFPPFADSKDSVVPELTVAKAVEIAVQLWQGRSEAQKQARLAARDKRPREKGEGLRDNAAVREKDGRPGGGGRKRAARLAEGG